MRTAISLDNGRNGQLFALIRHTLCARVWSYRDLIMHNNLVTPLGMDAVFRYRLGKMVAKWNFSFLNINKLLKPARTEG